MKKRTDPSFDYLKKLEAKEKSRRRYRWLAMGAVLAAGGGLAWVALPNLNLKGIPTKKNPAYREISGEYLSASQVKYLFSTDDSPVIVHYQNREVPDTLFKYDDFAAWFPHEQRPESASQAIFAVETRAEWPEQTAADAADDAEETPKVFGFKVLGDPIVGQTLTFQVLNFQEGADFELDFGTGRRKKVERISEYNFDQPGLYRVDLWVSEPDLAPELYATAMVEIKAASSVEASANPRNNLDVAPIEDLQNATESAQANAPSEIEPLPAAQPMEKAERMPSFPGGKAALYSFIHRNLRYPEASQAAQAEGKVHVRFLINEYGQVQEPVILQSLGEAYDAEVLRILRIMPRWEAGEDKGKKVPVYYQLRVGFDQFQ